MPKWFKFILGILLLPSCLGAVGALWKVAARSGASDTVWIPLLAGVLCWVVIYLLLPKPMWMYVFGHELTHAIWCWMFGGRLKKFKASSKGGHVVVTKTNFLIALAPYFFPLYALIVVGIFFLGHLLWNWSPYRPWFHLLLGAAYAFHVMLTWHVLQTRQSDITQQGYLFSGVVIFLGNMLMLLIAIPVLAAQVSVVTAFAWWFQSTGNVLHRLAQLF